MTHVRAPRSTTLRATYVFRRIRDWLGLPEAERQRIGTGKREYKWQLTSGRWKTLARNVARRLAITQYRKALNDTFVDTSTLCKEHLPAYLLQSVDAIAANADNLAELRLEVRAMVTTWRETRLEAIPI